MRDLPAMSFLILALTVIVSLAGLYLSPKIIERCMLRPYWLKRAGEYERLITSGFVHADLWHLAFNMLTFYFFAFALEDRIGSLKLLTLYLLGLVLSDLGTYLKHRDNPDYASLGASGARILGTLVHGLRKTGGRWGVAAICIGVGQGLAIVVEAV